MRMVATGALLALVCLPPLASAAEAENGKTFEIPYKFTAAKHIVVRAKINGKGPFNLILDTGAPALFVAVPVGKKAKAKADAEGWADLDRFEIEGGLVIPRVRARVETPFQLEGMNGMGLAGLEIHGLLGYEVLAKYRMTFDFTKDKLVFTELDHKPPELFRLNKGDKGKPEMGGLEMMGQIMKMLGQFLGRKAAPEVTLRGFLGMTLTDADEHPVVEAVLEKGPAGDAGLKKGDVVTKINGRTVTNVSDVLRLTAKLAGGKELTVTVQRGEESKEITIKTGEGI